MSSRLERLVTIQEEINRGRYPNVEKLCEMFEVRKRTVYEDIRALKEDLGLDIEYDRFHNGYINKNPKKCLPAFELTDGEVFALTLGKEMLSSYTGTSFETVLKAAIEKICQRLPDRVKIDANDIKCMVKFSARGLIPISRKLFLDLNRACEKNLLIDLTYAAASTGEVTQRRIEPYRLLEHRSAWYLIAYCQMRKDLREFALHRIHEYKLSASHFQPMEDATIDQWIASAFQLEHGDPPQRVVINFAPRAARYIRERKWHESQQLEEHADGSCTLEFVSHNLDEVKRWVLGYGAEATVLSPNALKNLVEEELRAAISNYMTTSISLSMD